MSEEKHLTLEEAQALVETIEFGPDGWKKWSARTDAERLALGLVVLNHSIKRGVSLRTLEAEMGISHTTLGRYKNKALESIQLPLVEEAQKEELDRLNRIIEIVWPAVENGDEKAIASYFKAAERRAKLLGLDKPIQVESTVREISAEEAELQAMLAQAERDEAMKAAQAVENV